MVSCKGSFYRAALHLLNSCFEFDIVYDNGVSLQKNVVYMKFPKVVPAVGANGPFYSNFAPPPASQACIFLKILRVGYIIISTQIKCET